MTDLEQLKHRVVLWKKMATLYRKAYHEPPPLMPAMPKPGVRRIARAEAERDALRKENECLLQMMTDKGVCVHCGTQRESQARDGSYCPECEPEKNPRLLMGHAELIPQWPWRALT